MIVGAINITLEYLDIYNETKDLLRYTSNSSVRVQILICLNEGIQTMSELKKYTGISSSTISNNLSNLEKRNITIKDGEKYALSPLGDILTLNLIENIKTVSVVNKFKKLWLNHLSDIPPALLKKVGSLYKASLIEAESEEIYKPHEIYGEVLRNSKYVKGVSPIFRFSYIDLYRNIVENYITVELILTKSILSETLSGIDSKSLEYLKEFMSQEKVKFWVINDAKTAFTVTDKYLSLGLFHEDGNYDPTRDLISDDNDAVTWGNQLFEYYKNQAEKLEL
ncbi:helix-turn-helix transcriptional regulator [Methanobacterium ferruginis]|uniref:helix-turn-helix transcriptional regulator n=1 Tax=Methanobacterium ferruginis TaxID=710191 RepID=UPI002572C32F|nr:winged helix-turn-helix domain-containing protein [Methanobacterium ferruginis]BDZ68956.1 transcriptional regulator [Methanobacterium ferruginis]